MTRPKGGPGPVPRQWASRMERREAQRPDRKGLARLRTARGGPDRKGLPKGLSPSPWRLPALHSPFGGRGKRDMRIPRIQE